ncbi:MAG: UDP-N-acetylmuramate:L-alanyl-gamma-D-glutamyl-meso-diaminopimelate ligase [Methylococcales bacterium]|nr:UDP-N-acetylmuramate:L-alanyl-gamma-D-glutamyl-meso-diaminopimelate ligase [Methylococcales bacterium]
MKIHILGICGTFMAGLAVLAKTLGHEVSGSDQNVYPPMSDQLIAQGITLREGYCAENLNLRPDLVIIGNALSRGNAEVEAVLNQGLRYTSGAQWLSENVLQDKWVLAVAGTHGKTTTSSMLAWILEVNGFNPSFLIGGIPLNFGISARLTDSNFFIIEADEYDCAFFDKRSKFVHYRPRTAVLNNLEYDHADIFPDLAAIQKQFNYFIRTVPSEGLLIAPEHDIALEETLALGCWTPVSYTSILGEGTWNADLLKSDGSHFAVYFDVSRQGEVHWDLTGEHNVRNALSALAAAHHVGVLPQNAIEALSNFHNVKRRMEVLISKNGVTIYDDFAHHPTAIATTLDGLRQRVGGEKIIAIVEPRSNTMRLGVHQHTLAVSLRAADIAIIYQPDSHSALTLASNTVVCQTIADIVARFRNEIQNGSHIVLMSNGSFGGLHSELVSLIAMKTE